MDSELKHSNGGERALIYEKETLSILNSLVNFAYIFRSAYVFLNEKYVLRCPGLYPIFISLSKITLATDSILAH